MELETPFNRLSITGQFIPEIRSGLKKQDLRQDI